MIRQRLILIVLLFIKCHKIASHILPQYCITQDLSPFITVYQLYPPFPRVQTVLCAFQWASLHGSTHLFARPWHPLFGIQASHTLDVGALLPFLISQVTMIFCHVFTRPSSNLTRICGTAGQHFVYCTVLPNLQLILLNRGPCAGRGPAICIWYDNGSSSARFIF
jgi:hypothetical protein